LQERKKREEHKRNAGHWILLHIYDMMAAFWAQNRGSRTVSTQPEDAALLKRIAAGDGNALLMLHQRYATLVYSMAWRVLNDAGMAEEVTQDIFLKLWQKSQHYDPQRGRFCNWLLSVTRFAAIDRLRHEKRAPLLSDLDGDPGDDASATKLVPIDHENWERGRHLRLLVEQLPANQRQLIELAYFGGLTHSELADQLKLPLGTVKSRLRQGLEKLRTLWLDASGVNR
jgi:RNA polymerase sigma-70 factor, ECF subfamily